MDDKKYHKELTCAFIVHINIFVSSCANTSKQVIICINLKKKNNVHRLCHDHLQIKFDKTFMKWSFKCVESFNIDKITTTWDLFSVSINLDLKHTAHFLLHVALGRYH